MTFFKYRSLDGSTHLTVEAETPERADQIFEYKTDEKLTSEVTRTETEELEFPRSTRVVRAEDCRVPILGGVYVLEFRELDGWAEVARVKFGPLWTQIWQQAVATYGEDSVRTHFVMDNAAKDDEYDYGV